MKAGKVGFIAHLDVNPVFHLPASLGYAAALKSVPLSLALVEAENETADACTYMLPIHSMFESWGDHSVREGIISLQQPVVAPLYATRQKEAVLLHWMSASGPFNESRYRDYIKKYWETAIFPAAGSAVDFTAFWQSSLHDGVIDARRSPVPARPALRADALAGLQIARSCVRPDGACRCLHRISAMVLLEQRMVAGIAASGVEDRVGQLRGDRAGNGKAP